VIVQASAKVAQRGLTLQGKQGKRLVLVTRITISDGVAVRNIAPMNSVAECQLNFGVDA
jgi:hypothetical protein